MREVRDRWSDRESVEFDDPAGRIRRTHVTDKPRTAKLD